MTGKKLVINNKFLVKLLKQKNSSHRFIIFLSQNFVFCFSIYCVTLFLISLSCLLIEERVRGRKSKRFMSSGFWLEVVVGAVLKLWSCYAFALCMLLWFVLNTAVSMSLRSKRTCYGVVVCYGGFQIRKIFSNFFLLLRVDLT